MKRIFKFVVLEIMVFLIAVAVFGQTPAPVPPDPSKYKPSEMQNIRLQYMLDEAKLANRDVMDAQARLNTAIAALRAEGEKIRIENKWPDTVIFNANSMTFVEAPPPPPPPAKKEEPKKP